MDMYKMIITSALEKVFPDSKVEQNSTDTYFTMLKNEVFCFQVAIKSPQAYLDSVTIKLSSPLSEYITLKTVENVPCAYPTHGNVDDNYLFTAPTLAPDLLTDCDGTLILLAGLWQSVWVDVYLPETAPAGVFPIEFTLYSTEGEILSTVTTSITVYDVILPKQELIRTEWFHTDCLADYYSITVFSEKHWDIIESFIKKAVKRGINMILTPTFTPPLDTAEGGERTTVQLIDVTKNNGIYSFNFDKLKRWVDLCKGSGVEYLEIAHLFSQWGAKYAPKVMATVDGEYKQIFGWNTMGTGEEYKTFLGCLLPQLTQKLEEYGIDDRTYFHISDEPGLEHLQSYQAAYDMVYPHLKGYKIIDALSNYEFYKTGAVKHPIPSNNHIEPFIEGKVPDLWTYYCTGQHIAVSNRFIAMPSARNRIIGTQLYKYDIAGFLHWGYNFYNSQYSIEHINPYFVTDSGKRFPSGDPFLVYPKADGTPEDSIRCMVFYLAVSDLRAFKLLEQFTSKEHVLSLIEGELSHKLTFSCYPTSASYLISLRNRVNKEISLLLSN